MQKCPFEAQKCPFQIQIAFLQTMCPKSQHKVRYRAKLIIMAFYLDDSKNLMAIVHYLWRKLIITSQCFRNNITGDSHHHERVVRCRTAVALRTKLLQLFLSCAFLSSSTIVRPHISLMLSFNLVLGLPLGLCP